MLYDLSGQKLPPAEMSKLVNTFAFHECGYIPDEYANVLHELSQFFDLALVIDIWSPKDRWLEFFETSGVLNLFSAVSFSSDHGVVKPSPKPFEMVITEMGVDKKDTLVVGDSIRRDLGGALAAGIDCVLVGDAEDPSALASYSNLIEFAEFCRKEITGK